ncbi:Hypothetical protein PACV_150 [Pacmanvirus A23]|uniref:Hypothetical protein n=1 Tax=Pacmanvirus A23 TaxID=1932881 RepID=UPI000A092450|nr:Hypothetical protein B9W72_gp148 [Pacmanvirus A23]SIP85865.1 Hypothetical protein PACV_150 [Pacmanvirus A23]
MDTEFQNIPIELDLVKCYIFTAALVIVLISSYFLSRYNLSDDRISTLGYLMMNFHQRPDYDDFMEVYNEHKKLLRQCGNKTKYWIYGVYLVHPQFFNASREETLKKWIPEIERGLRQVKSVPTPELLDSVWAIYFSTGDKKFSDIIKNIANSSNDLTVKIAAQWSYSDITGND